MVTRARNQREGGGATERSGEEIEREGQGEGLMSRARRRDVRYCAWEVILVEIRILGCMALIHSSHSFYTNRIIEMEKYGYSILSLAPTLPPGALQAHHPLDAGFHT